MNCFLCAQSSDNEILLKCFFSELKEKNGQLLLSDDLKFKYAHFFCSLFFSELDMIQQNDSKKNIFLKGAQKIKSDNYLEDCKICSTSTFGPCLVKCLHE